MALPTDNFRRQHNELLQIVGEMVPMLKADALAKDASAVRSLLSQLAGKLTVHLSMEDKVMYPKLTAHPDPAVSTKAKAFVDEMGGIKEVFSVYMKKWPTAVHIQQNAKDFVKETGDIFGALGKRIDRENNDLYMVVDRVGM